MGREGRYLSCSLETANRNNLYFDDDSYVVKVH
jgi:hypothetical protein